MNPIRANNLISVLRKLVATSSNNTDHKLGFTIFENYSKIMYHGSTKPIKEKDWNTNASGQFGKGLYLTEDRNLAGFYSKGGKQGCSSQKLLKDEQYVYKFKVNGRAFVITDMQDAVTELRGEIDDASDGLMDSGGDYNNTRVTKYFAELASDYHNCQLVVLPKSVKNCDLLTPQTLVLNTGSFKFLGVVKSP